MCTNNAGQCSHCKTNTDHAQAKDTKSHRIKYLGKQYKNKQAEKRGY